MDEQKKPRINWVGGGIMAGFMGVIDLLMAAVNLLAIIPFIGVILALIINAILALIGALAVGIWLALKGMWSLQRGFALVGVMLGKGVPLLGILPGFSGFVIWVVAQTIATDKLGVVAPATARLANKITTQHA